VFILIKLLFPEGSGRQPLHSYWLSERVVISAQLDMTRPRPRFIRSPRCGSRLRCVR